MIDLQNLKPEIPLELNKVGVKGLSHPIDVVINKNEKVTTNAIFNMYVNLNSNKRGAHMSRFVEILNQQNWELSIPGLNELLYITKEKNEAENAFIEANFDIFLQKSAPISKLSGLVNYKVKLHGELKDNNVNLKCNIKIPVTTLCPCSKEISEYGAHNQRTYITVEFTTKENIYIKEIIEKCEKTASSEIYSVLKRTDEKYVSEKAYENPKFVEDIAREISQEFNKDNRILGYRITVESLESIHNHSAVAEIIS